MSLNILSENVDIWVLWLVESHIRKGNSIKFLHYLFNWLSCYFRFMGHVNHSTRNPLNRNRNGRHVYFFLYFFTNRAAVILLNSKNTERNPEIAVNCFICKGEQLSHLYFNTFVFVFRTVSFDKGTIYIAKLLLLFWQMYSLLIMHISRRKVLFNWITVIHCGVFGLCYYIIASFFTSCSIN